MTEQLTPAELAELELAFRDLLNYEGDDPTAPIDPVTQVTPEGDSCLHIAALRGDLRSVELLVKVGVDVNLQGDMGYTPLHYARTPEVVEFLLTHGARKDIKNEFGKAPIGWDREP